jgi:hypothetical protein
MRWLGYGVFLDDILASDMLGLRPKSDSFVTFADFIGPFHQDAESGVSLPNSAFPNDQMYRLINWAA